MFRQSPFLDTVLVYLRYSFTVGTRLSYWLKVYVTLLLLVGIRLLLDEMKCRVSSSIVLFSNSSLMYFRIFQFADTSSVTFSHTISVELTYAWNFVPCPCRIERWSSFLHKWGISYFFSPNYRESYNKSKLRSKRGVPKKYIVLELPHQRRPIQRSRGWLPQSFKSQVEREQKWERCKETIQLSVVAGIQYRSLWTIGAKLYCNRTKHVTKWSVLNSISTNLAHGSHCEEEAEYHHNKKR